MLMVAEHYGRAASLVPLPTSSPVSWSRSRSGRSKALEATDDASAGLYSNREAQGHYESALGLDERLNPTAARGSRRSWAMSRCGSDASTAPFAPGRRRWTITAGRRTSRGSATYTERSARACGKELTARDRSSTTSEASTCSRTGHRAIELVRLYEAASLYMHTGDNMLAIYASEKALRLAERLGEAAAASRAHGIFGRVFGRIGDSERAQENLERSVSSPAGDPASGAGAERPRLSPRGLRGRLRTRARRVRRRARPGAGDGRSALAGGDPRGARNARRLSGRLAGRRAPGRRRPRHWPSARAWTESCASRTRCAVSCAGTRATSMRRSCSSGRSTSPIRSAARKVAFESLSWLATVLRDRGDHADADQTLARALDLCERLPAW